MKTDSNSLGITPGEFAANADATTGRASMRPYLIADTSNGYSVAHGGVEFGAPTGGQGWPAMGRRHNIPLSQIAANARLIADAFNTANKTQKLPSELAGEVERLRAALDLVIGQYEQVCDDNNAMGWPGMVAWAKEMVSGKVTKSLEEYTYGK